MHTGTITTAALLLAALTACTSSSQPKPEPSSAKPTIKIAGPSPTKTGPLTLGTPSKWDETEAAGTTTVIAYTQRVARHAVQPEQAFGSESKGFVWAAVEIKVCVTRGDTTVSNRPWSLAYADGARIYPSSVMYANFPQPVYPIGDTAVNAGECVRGKTVFPVPGKQRPTKILYAAVAEWEQPIAWAVPAK